MAGAYLPRIDAGFDPAFFARKDTWGPGKFAVVSVIVNLACGLSLLPLSACRVWLSAHRRRRGSMSR